jgi:hypothetical protein
MHAGLTIISMLTRVRPRAVGLRRPRPTRQQAPAVEPDADAPRDPARTSRAFEAPPGRFLQCPKTGGCLTRSRGAASIGCPQQVTLDGMDRCGCQSEGRRRQDHDCGEPRCRACRTGPTGARCRHGSTGQRHLRARHSQGPGDFVHVRLPARWGRGREGSSIHRGRRPAGCSSDSRPCWR